MQENASLASVGKYSPFHTPLRLLSHLSRNNVRLNSVDMSVSTPGETALKIEGEVIGPKERQEAEFYTYLTNIEKHPAVKEIDLKSKTVANQQGSSKLQFLLHIVTINAK